MTSNPANYSILIQLARENRKNATEAESVLWKILRSKAEGIKFRRQHVIGDYIADFISLRYGLIVELDGKYNILPEQQISDEERTQRLNEMGFRVIRITNEELLFKTDDVIERIKKECINH